MRFPVLGMLGLFIMVRPSTGGTGVSIQQVDVSVISMRLVFELPALAHHFEIEIQADLACVGCCRERF